MIQKIDIGNSHVLAFRVEGEVDEQDMKENQKTIKPELESDEKFNLYIEMPASATLQPSAIQERVSFILSNFGDVMQKVNRLALVTDKNWMQHLSKGVFSMLPAIDQETFAFEEVEEAREWVAD